jgi:hypothetical protein
MATTPKTIAKMMIGIGSLVVSLVITSCGLPTPDQESRLRDGPAPSTEAGTLALQDEGQHSVVLVHLPIDRDDVGLCLGASSFCLDPSTPLIELIKTAPGYWKSSSAIQLEDNLVLHVVAMDTGTRSILLSAKISANASETPQRQPTSVLSPPENLPKMRPIPRVQLAFDYQGTLSRESPTAAVIRMVIQNGPLKESKRVKVKSTLVNLRNSSVKIPLDREVDVLENRRH